MHRLYSILALGIMLVLFIGIVLVALRDPELAAVVAVFTAVLSQSLIATLSNYTAGVQLTSEGYAERGTIVVIAGPDGPFVGKVIDRALRVTVLETADGAAQLIVPNAMLTASAVKRLEAWPLTASTPQ